MKDHIETIAACQSMQLTASALLGDLTANPEYLTIPEYRNLVEKVYMAARQAATVARILGDEQTAKFTDRICNQLVEKANL